jgi:peroxiredoxin
MDLTKFPSHLPQPVDDGLCDHLLRIKVPSITLPSTKGNYLDVCKIDANFVILYFFPMMAISQKDLPSGWDDIPGARGCTPQNITINEHNNDLQKYDAIPVGVSTQLINELLKIPTIREISQIILSDKDLKFQEKLNVPTFQVKNKIMYKRFTLILKKSEIIKVFYPIFPPDKHVFEIVEWLEKNS